MLLLADFSVSQSVLALSPIGTHDQILVVLTTLAILLSRGVFPEGRSGLSCNMSQSLCS